MVTVRHNLTAESPTCTSSLSTSTPKSGTTSSLDSSLRPFVARAQNGGEPNLDPALVSYKKHLMDLEQKAKREQDLTDEPRHKKASLLGSMIESGVDIPVDGAISGGGVLLDVQMQYILLELQEKKRLLMVGGAGGDIVGKEIKVEDGPAAERDHVLQDYCTQLMSVEQHEDRMMKEERLENTPFKMEDTDDVEVEQEESDSSNCMNTPDQSLTDHNLPGSQTQTVFVEEALLRQEEQSQQISISQIKHEPLSQQEPTLHRSTMPHDNGALTHQLDMSIENYETKIRHLEAENKSRLILERQRQERPIFQRTVSEADRPTFRQASKSDGPYSCHDYTPSPPQQQARLWSPNQDMQKANVKYQYSDDSADTSNSVSPLPQVQAQPQATTHHPTSPAHQTQQSQRPFEFRPFQSSPPSYFEMDSHRRFQHHCMTEQSYSSGSGDGSIGAKGGAIHGFPEGLNHPLTQKEKAMILVWRREQADEAARNKVLLGTRKGPVQAALDDYEWVR